MAGEAVDVIEFEAARFGAAAAAGVHEGAAAFVAGEDGSADWGGDVAGGGAIRIGRLRRSRVGDQGEALLLDALDEDVQSLLQDRRWIAVGNAVAEKILSAAQFVVQGTGRGELDPIQVLGERCDDGVLP
jgi:hypothetical protein